MADTTFSAGTVIASTWLNDVNDLTYGAPLTTAGAGAGLIGFNPASSYAASTVGRGILGAETTYNILKDIPVAEWAAVLDGTTTTDHSTILQARIDAMASTGGCIFIPGTLLCNTPIVLKGGVSLQGLGSYSKSCIKKDSTTTKAVTIVASALVVYGGASLPANINAVLVLTDNGTATGRYNGTIRGLRIESTLATAGNYETQKAEFGIVSIGSVSDSTFDDIYILHCQYAAIFPVLFASHVTRIMSFECLRGPAVDNGTSTPFFSCYAHYCRDWGLFLRDLKYSNVMGNACDSLNDPAKYPTRTRECSAYRLRSAVGMVVMGNGDEQTYGNSFFLETFTASVMKGNVSIGIGSDYAGAEHIAWIKSDNAMDGSDISDNFAYDVKGTGLTSGGASAGSHHNIYAPTPTSCFPRKFDNNVVAAAKTSMTVEAGWGNDSLIPQSQPTTITAATYSVLVMDSSIIANRAGTVTLTLPSAANVKGKELTVRTIQAQTVVSASSNIVPLVGGAAGTAILAATAGKWARLRSDGTNWQIMEGN